MPHRAWPSLSKISRHRCWDTYARTASCHAREPTPSRPEPRHDSARPATAAFAGTSELVARVWETLELPGSAMGCSPLNGAVQEFRRHDHTSYRNTISAETSGYGRALEVRRIDHGASKLVTASALTTRAAAKSSRQITKLV
jgi:hypothetical protein